MAISGMVQPGDALVLFSNSGGDDGVGRSGGPCTPVSGMPLIAITGRAGIDPGALAADVVLLLPARAPEACAVTSAPTTSTTMQLALGDALGCRSADPAWFHSDGFPRLPSWRPARAHNCAGSATSCMSAKRSRLPSQPCPLQQASAADDGQRVRLRRRGRAWPA